MQILLALHNRWRRNRFMTEKVGGINTSIIKSHRGIIMPKQRRRATIR